MVLHHASGPYLQHGSGPSAWAFRRQASQVLAALSVALPTFAKIADTPAPTFFPAPPPTELPAITPAASVSAWDQPSPATTNNIEETQDKAHDGPPFTILTGLGHYDYAAFPLVSVIGSLTPLYSGAYWHIL